MHFGDRQSEHAEVTRAARRQQFHRRRQPALHDREVAGRQHAWQLRVVAGEGDSVAGQVGHCARVDARSVDRLRAARHMRE